MRSGSQNPLFDLQSRKLAESDCFLSCPSQFASPHVEASIEKQRIVSPSLLPRSNSTTPYSNNLTSTMIPTLKEMYSRIHEMDTRIRQLEMIVYDNGGAESRFSEGQTLLSSFSKSTMSLSLAEDMRSSKESTTNQPDCVIQRGDLDRVCLPFLELTSHPSMTQLNEICRQLHSSFPKMFRQEIISTVRRWFRKRREEMSQRIFTSCRKHFGQKDYSRDECLELIDSIPLDFNLIERIRIEANLEIANVDASTEFCQTKVPATSHLHVL